MDISVESYKRVDLVTVSGRIDSSNVSELETALTELHDSGRRNLALDLSEVDYMSSAGLRALVAAKRRNSKGIGGGVIIVAPSERVHEVLELAGLSSLFDVYEDRASAVGSF